MRLRTRTDDHQSIIPSANDEDYTPFTAVSPAAAQAHHLQPDQRDENRLDPASGPGSGVIELGREGIRFFGRGAGSLFIVEDDSVSSSVRTVKLTPVNIPGVAVSLHDGGQNHSDGFARVSARRSGGFPTGQALRYVQGKVITMLTASRVC